MTNTDNMRKEFCDKLREGAEMLASGKEHIFLREFDIQTMLGDSAEGINQSYIRTIMNRVPSVKAIGTIKIKRVIGSDELPDGYHITLNREPRRKVVTNDDLPKLEQSWKVKFINQLLKTSPMISDLRGEQLQGAAIAIERFAEMLKEMVKDD